ncbi:unnamed protein product [Echinostoma caproni]|uniref:GATA-type domain-containing protein n=1 Tax=Echinostoma caproni TaxID=27848 RepID=A0A183AC06_9TREM|nr:unnamed protein product [Echinostoma caproni]
MQPCPNVSKPASLRPPSSVSLLAEQLKSSSLNEANPGVGSVWWSQSHADGFVGVLADAPVPMSCDVCDSGTVHEHPRSHGNGRCCVLCMSSIGGSELPLRPGDTNSSTRPTNLVPRVPAALSTNGTTGELFGTSPYAPSSVSSQGQSEPEEEEMDSYSDHSQLCCLFRSYVGSTVDREIVPVAIFFLTSATNPRCSHLSKNSASAPTTAPVYTPYHNNHNPINNTSTSRSSLAFNTTCVGTSFIPSFNVSPSNQNRLSLDKTALWSITTPCSCQAHLLPAKRACRSLSASASAQQQHQQLHSHHNHATFYLCGQTRSNRHSQLIEAHLFESHFSTLPRPIAIRPTPTSKSASTEQSSNTDQLSVGGINGSKSNSSGVMLRASKQREYCYGSRLSWHHPVFSSGLGAKAQHPSYGVHFACSSHSCTAATRATTVSTAGASMMMASGDGPGNAAGSQPPCSGDMCSGRMCKQRVNESMTCASCIFPNSPRACSGIW